jgi:hypothetical protein
MRFASLALVAGVALSGCATARIDALGTGPGPGPADERSYAFTSARAEDGTLWPLVETHLAANGFIRREGASARYFVELGYSARPTGVGAYALEAPIDKDDRSGWIAPPAHRRPWTSTGTRVCVLSVRFIDARTGAEAYRVAAAERRRKGDCAAIAPSLAAAALSEIPLAPRTGKGV